MDDAKTSHALVPALDDTGGGLIGCSQESLKDPNESSFLMISVLFSKDKFKLNFSEIVAALSIKLLKTSSTVLSNAIL
ncbi:hypothetical protein WICMUC_004958 [Wickerhamomyces mucosus]|uniref:Uncharacterized protein n=1 Tax=Wickerhamomyces mucosus TaxID=1378264 RepID=A0A9P8PCZ9_9ASCO|nr:hypothetical protein WICMUC_004958 [Wickerhamomyces mucosus]